MKIEITPEESGLLVGLLAAHRYRVTESYIKFFSKAELRKIEDLRTFFIYISNRPSVLVEVKKS